MALRNSEMWCKVKAGYVKSSMTAATFALVDGGASDDTVTDSGNGFLTCSPEGFAVGDFLEVVGAVNASNDILKPILAVTSGQINIPTGSFAAGQSIGTSLTLRARAKAVFSQVFRDAHLDIYSGTIPATPDDTENGTLLCTFTGLRFGAEVWDSTNLKAYCDLISTGSATAVAGGDAGWFRLRGGGVYTTGASTTMIRIDGTVGVGSGDLQISNSTIKINTPQSISSLRIYMKQAA